MLVRCLITIHYDRYTIVSDELSNMMWKRMEIEIYGNSPSFPYRKPIYRIYK